MTTEIKNLNLEQIRIDGGTQPRATIDIKVVTEYAELYGQGVKFPPVTVFFDGTNYWLADGFHRYWANKKIICDYVFADVHPGTQRDAILYSVGANAEHGLRRTNADKRKAVLILLEDEEWSKWSDREIAKKCGVGHAQVSRYRTSLSQRDSEKTSPQPRAYKTKHGTTAKMKVSNIGRKSRGEKKLHPKAMKPVRGHSLHLPRTALELHHDPQLACRTILSAMGVEFARALVKEITTYLEGVTNNDCQQ